MKSIRISRAWHVLVAVAVMALALAVDFGAKLESVAADQAKQLSGVSTAGVVVRSTSPGGLAEDLGLKPDDVIHEINGTKIRTPRDAETAIGKREEQITLTYARAGRVRTVTVSPLVMAAARVAFVGSETSETADLLRGAGLTVDATPGFPTQLSGKYSAVVLENANACKPAAADRLRKFIASGGGVVLQGGLPASLCSGSSNLSPIADWFGASQLASGVWDDFQTHSFGELVVTLNRPLGASMRNREKIFGFTGDQNYCAVFGGNMGDRALAVAGWANMADFNGFPISIFTNEYGSGRVFYQFKTADPNYPKLGTLFITGVRWAARMEEK